MMVGDGSKNRHSPAPIKERFPGGYGLAGQVTDCEETGGAIAAANLSYEGRRSPGRCGERDRPGVSWSIPIPDGHRHPWLYRAVIVPRRCPRIIYKQSVTFLANILAEREAGNEASPPTAGRPLGRTNKPGRLGLWVAVTGCNLWRWFDGLDREGRTYGFAVQTQVTRCGIS